MNRKGVAIDDIGPLVFVMVVTVLSVVFLFGNAKLNELNNEKAAQVIEFRYTARATLHDYLETSIEFSGAKMSLLSFLAPGDYPTKQEVFNRHAKAFFSERWKEGCWEVQLRSDTDDNRPSPNLGAASAGALALKNCMDNAKYRFDDSVPLPSNEKPLQFRLIIAK